MRWSESRGRGIAHLVLVRPMKEVLKWLLGVGATLLVVAIAGDIAFTAWITQHKNHEAHLMHEAHVIVDEIHAHDASINATWTVDDDTPNVVVRNVFDRGKQDQILAWAQAAKQQGRVHRRISLDFQREVPQSSAPARSRPWQVMCLVRLVKRSLTYPVAFACLALTLSSCMSIPPVQGDYRLSWGEIRELNHLVAHRTDIRKPLGLVRMESADRGEVSSGNVWEQFGKITVFTIRKKNGRWMIDESTVKQTEAIVTS
jgi:hypothetical protein